MEKFVENSKKNVILDVPTVGVVSLYEGFKTNTADNMQNYLHRFRHHRRITTP